MLIRLHDEQYAVRCIYHEIIVQSHIKIVMCDANPWGCLRTNVSDQTSKVRPSIV